MRVIAGKHRGAVLAEFKGQNIRPTSDRAKEAVFNMIQADVEESVCLDLCCGTGSLGIEALSRGARKVNFVDVSKDSVELTKKNLQKVRENASVILSDAIAYLKGATEKYDIIFIDPPYMDDVSERAVKVIIERNLLSDDGFIVFERDRPFAHVEGASAFKMRKYGKAYVTLIRKEKRALFAGTFDPFTVGHQEVVELALKKYDKLNIVVMVNDQKKTAFSLDDRVEMIMEIYRNREAVFVDSWNGMLVDYMKQNALIYNVRGIRNSADLEYEKEMEKYNSNAYESIVYDYIYTDNPVSSSSVRERVERGEGVGDLVDEKILKYFENK